MKRSARIAIVNSRQGRVDMDIRELKTMDAPGLVRLAGSFAIENAGVLRRQELVYRIIQAQARKNGQLIADGVLETSSGTDRNLSSLLL